MAAIDASGLLRPGLLAGVSLLLAPDPAEADFAGSLGEAVLAAYRGLGANVSVSAASSQVPLEEQDAATDLAVRDALADTPGVDVLVIDSAALLARAGASARASRKGDEGDGDQADGDEVDGDEVDGDEGDGDEAEGDEADGDRAHEPPDDQPHSALAACLQSAWVLTHSVFDLALLPQERGGRILYLAPRPGSGPHSEPVRAGLENLARTLSIEWARHGITAVTIAPGALTAAEEVAALAAYLGSSAGAYFSGCLLDLRGIEGSRQPPGSSPTATV
jgi:NAD(P)-dependent dehydrogenase (short-subunit alcohol dehydrogenase family)